MKTLQQKTRRTRTEAEQETLLRLPGTLVFLEEQIDSVVTRLGSEEFREVKKDVTGE